ncbi:MAG: hypothetical protein ACM3U2_04835 [Deltaproteobacteria bacterium]
MNGKKDNHQWHESHEEVGLIDSLHQHVIRSCFSWFSSLARSTFPRAFRGGHAANPGKLQMSRNISTLVETLLPDGRGSGYAARGSGWAVCERHFAGCLAHPIRSDPINRNVHREK